MRHAIRSALCGLILAHPAATCRAQHHQGHYEGHPGGSGVVLGLGLVGSGAYGGGAYYAGGLGVPAPYLGGLPGGGMGFLPLGQEGPGGLMLPHAFASTTRPQAATASLRRADPARATELTDVGDRSFRGGNYRRAEDRYQLAARTNRDSPTPHVHLAQVAAIRGDYALAAGRLRDAVATTRGAGWLLEARDIQAMYGEPGDFHKQIAHLESFLQTHPDDKNAWFVLGAQHFLSGNPKAASDVFLRLNDGQPDEAVAAFSDAALVSSRTLSHHP